MLLYFALVAKFLNTMNHIWNFETHIRNQIWKWNFIWCSWHHKAKVSVKVKIFTLRKRGLHSELFWSEFSRICPEYGEIRGISSYSVQIWSNTERITLNTDIFHKELISWSLVVSNSIHKYINSIESCCKYIVNPLFTIRLGEFGLLRWLEPNCT